MTRSQYALKPSYRKEYEYFMKYLRRDMRKLLLLVYSIKLEYILAIHLFLAAATLYVGGLLCSAYV
jgi:hypothetical protein